MTAAADVFGTAALRRAVTDAWGASPTRFREDANTEEDYARGYYRGRVVVEIAQNAADAAARAGAPGRLRLRLDPPAEPGGPWWLLAANTGAPLDAAGVRSLAAMRASAKRPAPADPGAVGRFGVGFAALRSVADVIQIGSVAGGVEFSVERTAAALADLARRTPGLAGEVARRTGRLPALRLPFEHPVPVPAGWDTVVALAVRDAEALADVRAQLAAVDDALLLALPALDRIEVEVEGESRTWSDAADRWTVLRRSGMPDPTAAAERPVEERDLPWTVTWALPRTGAPAPASSPAASPTVSPAASSPAASPAASSPAAWGRTVLHAPTPTDEELTFPALLIASFPLEPSRRRVARGALAEEVARHAGRAYAEFLAALARQRDVLALVPTAIPAGPIDAACRDAAEAAARDTPLLRAPTPDDGALIRPRDAVAIRGAVGSDAAATAALAPFIEGLVVVAESDWPAARRLGVRAISPADALEEMAAPADPAALLPLYDALAPQLGSPGVAEAAAALPVPLLDGRIVRGVRGLIRPGGGSALSAQAAWDLGLRVIHPRAAHPILERLGARPAAAESIAAEPAVRHRVLDLAAAADGGGEPDIAPLLDLAAAARVEGAQLPFWWGELPVPTAAGGWAAAREVALPGSWAADVLDLPVLAADVVARWGLETFAAVGVRHEPAVYRVRDVVTPLPGDDRGAEPADDPTGPQAWLSDWAGYLEHLADVFGPGRYVGDLEAVADLDTIADDAWAPALAAVAADPAARAAALTRARDAANGRTAPSYAAWWLQEEWGGPFAAADGVPFLPRLPRAFAGLDPAMQAAFGAVGRLEDLSVARWPDLLSGLPDVGVGVDPRAATALWRGLAGIAAAGADLGELPARLPALTADGVVICRVEDVAAAADPMWRPVRPVLPAPAGAVEAVADLVGVDLVDAAPPPDAPGRRRPIDPALAPLLGRDHWWAHERLTVGGRRVPWWVGADGRVHAEGTAALAAALAAAAGRYDRRFLVRAALADPAAVPQLIAESVWDPDVGR